MSQPEPSGEYQNKNESKHRKREEGIQKQRHAKTPQQGRGDTVTKMCQNADKRGRGDAATEKRITTELNTDVKIG